MLTLGGLVSLTTFGVGIVSTTLGIGMVSITLGGSASNTLGAAGCVSCGGLVVSSKVTRLML